MICMPINSIQNIAEQGKLKDFDLIVQNTLNLRGKIFVAGVVITVFQPGCLVSLSRAEIGAVVGATVTLSG